MDSAIEAVLRGKQFFSSALKSDESTQTAGEKKLHLHEVQFYSDDAFLLEKFAGFIAVALKSGRAAIVVITESILGYLDSLSLSVRCKWLN